MERKPILTSGPTLDRSRQSVMPGFISRLPTVAGEIQITRFPQDKWFMLQVVQKEHFFFFSHEQFGPLRLHCAQPPPQQENIKQSRHSKRLLPHWKTQHNHFIPYSLQRKRVRGREKEREVILAQTCCLIMPHVYAEKHLRYQTELVNKSRHLGFQINLTEVNICYRVSMHLM